MGWLEAIAAITVAGLAGLSQVIVSRNKNGKPTVTNEEVSNAVDPGVEALSSVIDLAKEVGSLSSRLGKVERENESLARENRTFRRVILSVMDMLRRKPPETPETILAFILEHLPYIGKDRNT